MPVIHRDTDYALRALALLAQGGEVVPVSALAEAEGVPEDFLRKIMQRLNRAGLVESVQGPFGGYKLIRDPGDVTLLDVTVAVQGPIAINACFADPRACRNLKLCGLRRQLMSLQQDMESRFADISLAGVIESAADAGSATT